MTYEHSTAEAVAVMSMLNHVMRCVDGGEKLWERLNVPTAEDDDDHDRRPAERTSDRPKEDLVFAVS